MTSLPENEFDPTMEPGVKWAVFLGPEDGTAIGSKHLVDYLIPQYIDRTAGGRKLDSCVLTWDLGKTGDRVVDLQTPTRFARQIEIRVVDPELEPDEWKVLFWGDLSTQNITIGDGETMTVVGKIARHHFGEPLTHYLVWNAVAQDYTEIYGLPIFNPLIDGIIEPNMGSKRHLTPNNNYQLWVDPETVRTPEARLRNEESASLWTLPEAIKSLCELVNPTGSDLLTVPFIFNPDIINIVELDGDQIRTADAIFDAVPAPYNIKLRLHQWLPDYLDKLLNPHGFGWFVSHNMVLSDPEDPDSTLSTERRIKIYKKGVGVEREVYHQAPGEKLDLFFHNVESVEVQTDVTQIANKFVGFGSPDEHEVTMELYRGWESADDAITPDQLRKSLKDFPDSQYPKTLTQDGKPNAWRRWVGNEAADYGNLRASIPSKPNLVKLFGAALSPRRRKIGPCLTLDQNGKRPPPVIEWYNGEVWAKVNSSWGARVLKHEIGVYFDADQPPAEIINAGANARLRITGTVTADARLKTTSARQDESPSARDVTLTLDLSDRFHFREVVADGAWTGFGGDDVQSIFTSTLIVGTAGTAARDDTTACQTYVDRLRAISESALMTAQIPLWGLHTEYEIGDLITKVAGRNISFNRNSDAAATKKYLQISGIRQEYQAQRTILTVQAEERLF